MIDCTDREMQIGDVVAGQIKKTFWIAVFKGFTDKTIQFYVPTSYLGNNNLLSEYWEAGYNEYHPNLPNPSWIRESPKKRKHYNELWSRYGDQITVHQFLYPCLATEWCPYDPNTQKWHTGVVIDRWPLEKDNFIHIARQEIQNNA